MSIDRRGLFVAGAGAALAAYASRAGAQPEGPADTNRPYDQGQPPQGPRGEDQAAAVHHSTPVSPPRPDAIMLNPR